MTIPPILDGPRITTAVASPGIPVSTINVSFPVFGAQEDLTVTVNGSVLATSLWTFTSPSGPLSLQALPITDGVVTFTPPIIAATGSIKVSVSGSWQPRQLVVPSAPGITRLEYEQSLSTLIASNRELLTMSEAEVARAEAAENALAATLATGSPIPLPNSLPAGAGLWWNNGGLVSVSYAGEVAPTVGQFLSYTANGWAPVAAPSGGGTPTPGSITYTLGKTGGVAQTLQARLQRTFYIEDFGGVGDGATNNSPALNAALAACQPSGNTSGGKIVFGPGIYRFTTAITYTMANARHSITIEGAGTLLTVLQFTATNGIAITAQNIQNTFHLRDFTMATTLVGGGVGLALVGVGANSGQQFQSDIINVDFQGNDISNGGSTEYWAKAIYIHNWGSINGFNVNTWGPHQAPLSAGGGIGLVIEGDAATSSFTTIINFSQSSFNYHATGVELGVFWQGVTFNQCNWNGASGTSAIQQDGGSTSVNALLAVFNCQINYGGSSGTSQIAIASPVNTMTFIGNTITMAGNSSSGILAVAGCTGLIVHGNIFNKFQGTTGNIGIIYNGTGGSVLGNWFQSLTTGVDLQGSSTNVNVSQNSYTTVTNPVVNAGSGNSVGVASV